ncbi:MAG: substrate-binding domain-containing protein [Minwuia sp.]|uniref:substrate-binding domain-containing protein n=1 Tax=Minwuia sp. TaxID=2493630 RepID=UPI003A854B03
MRKVLLTAGVAVAFAGAAEARDRISIVGSSTVFPYTQAVAEEFANKTGNAAPVVESTGTGGGMKIFCGGIGEGHPDITGASRAMKKSEWENCQANGVDSVSEALIGFDGIALAHSRKGPDMDVSKAQLFLALAAKVPVDGKIVDNPYTTWNQINAKLPSTPITVYGPPPTSGTRDAWVELVMEEGCGEFEAVKALSKDEHKSVCERMRTDGPFIEAGENDNLIVQRLDADPNAYGIFGFSFLYENQDKLMGAKVGGVAPSFETIESGDYGVSRPLFFYVKNAHRGVIPGLNEFIEEYMSDAALSSGGYLNERGLVPLNDTRRSELQDAILNGKQFTRYAGS